MSTIRPFRLNRRSFLKGLGVTACLPYMECMAKEGSMSGQRAQAPKRLAYIYVPYGVSMPGEDSEFKQWNWFPQGEGHDYTFTNVLQSLTPFKKQLSILGGLSHPKSRRLMGHIAGDTFLTAGDLRGEYKNSISVDQFAAYTKKQNTRYPSLVLSTDGGVGFKSRGATLSYNSQGNPIPSEHNHRQIFERYFSVDGIGSTAQRKQELARKRKIVDLILEDSKRLQHKLGVNDKHKLDQHMTNLSQLEEQIQRNETWLDVPLKDFSADHIDFAADANINPEAYIRTMMDLIVLAFQLDLTEVATYMMAREDGMGLGDAFPKLALGLKKGHHKISHDKSKGHWQEWGQYDQWLAGQFSYFLERMHNTQDEFGSLLDNTQVLYGSACSSTHNARNYPLILAGGKNMGLKHGQYHKFSEKVPLSNLYLTMLQAAGVPTSRFADSLDDHNTMNDLFLT